MERIDRNQGKIINKFMIILNLLGKKIRLINCQLIRFFNRKKIIAPVL